ncbi:hypothetical protein J2S41_005353 [Catenuloplanes atrovinosus]|uniref:Uncharacterized protein n=1 Tax=Catenuloplanes atrovinosus TaxID=137266 RepID=A0AAE3YTY0_9ACTN|nr:hypothetical protein [Catenuloplanes atrovinosus]
MPRSRRVPWPTKTLRSNTTRRDIVAFTANPCSRIATSTGAAV